MDSHFGDWYRVVGIDADHDKLNRRWKAVEGFAAKADVARVLDLARLFHGLPSAEQAFAGQFAAAFQKADSAFPMQDNAFELALLAGASLSVVLAGKRQTLADVAAFAAVCPVFCGQRAELPVPEVVGRAKSHLVQRRSSLRSPSRTDMASIAGPRGDDVNGLAEVWQTSDLAQIGGPTVSALKALHASVAAVVKAARQLQDLHRLYREDSNVLWWTIGGHSQDLDVPIAEIQLPAATLVVGKELAGLVEVVPGPFAARAILDRALAHGADGRARSITVAKAVNAADGTWKRAWAEQVGKSPGLDLCPVLLAVVKCVEVSDESAWQAAFKSASGMAAAVALSPLDLAVQAYEECVFVKLLES